MLFIALHWDVNDYFNHIFTGRNTINFLIDGESVKIKLC